MLAGACRDHQRRCASTTTTGAAASQRRVEPHRLVNCGPALVPGRLGHRPGGLADVPGRPDAPAVSRRTAFDAARRCPTTEVMALDLAAASRRPRRRYPGAGHRPCAGRGDRRAGRAVGRDGGGGRRRHVHPRHRRRHLEILAVHLGMLDADFSVTDPPELASHLRRWPRAMRGPPCADPHRAASGVVDLLEAAPVGGLELEGRVLDVEVAGQAPAQLVQHGRRVGARRAGRRGRTRR